MQKLLFILGAGSSKEQGFPSVIDLDSKVREWAETRPNQNKNPDFYDLLWRNRDRYASEAPEVVAWQTKPNYERVLGDLQLLMNASLEMPYGDPMLQWIAMGPLGETLRTPKSGTAYYIVQAQLEHLLERLALYIRGHSKTFEHELSFGCRDASFGPYRQLFAVLGKEFDIGIYNLNYDVVALNALPDTFAGFDRKSGEFCPSEVLSRKEWNFLYHLHGSVHNRIRNPVRDMDSKDFGPKINWFNNLNQAGDTEDWSDVSHPIKQSDQKSVMLSSLIAGGWKLDQLQAEPFSTFYSCLPRHIYEADAIVIGGYGFGDSHINSILTSMLRSKANRGKRPRVLVLDFENQRKPLAKRRGDQWANTMANTLGIISRGRFRAAEHREQSHEDLPDSLPDGTFEQTFDESCPVAVWNSGFLSGAKRAEKIVKWLMGSLNNL